jgi:hypothetical protein
VTDTTETTLEKPASSTPAAATEAAPVDSSAAEPAKAAPLATDTAQVSQEPAKDTPAPEAVADWITAAARGDEKRLERLKRFTDPGALMDSYLNAEAQLSKRGVSLPGEKATPEEIAAFHKQVGVPEKPEDYKVAPKLPEGFEFNELDKGVVSSITQKMHARGGLAAHPQMVQLMQEVYAEASEEAQAQLVARATEIHNETQAALEKEWGPDKARNLGFAKSVVDRFTSGEPEEVRDLLQTPLMNGAKLGDHPVFIRMLAKLGREFGDDPLLSELGSTGDTTATLEAEKAAILKLRADGKFGEYDGKAARLNQINDALARQARKK